MTIKEVIGLLLIMLAAFLFWRIAGRVNKLRAQNDQILDDELKRVKGELEDAQQPITTTLLESYGFKIYETKDVTYAVNGAISMTQREGYWETEIQAPPPKSIWRDTHIYIGHLLYFCEKHDLKLTKKEDDE